MTQKYAEVLQRFWGYDSFKPGQYELIDAVCTHRDALGLMATGSGKSLCYQIPGVMMDGLCLVISPLIALMKDQQESLSRQGLKSIIIHAGQDYREQDRLLDNAAFDDKVKFLFVSPERLSSRMLLDRVQRMRVSFIAVDEAHCISEWGQDFRPAYRNISDIKLRLPDVRILALTATATPEVRTDIVQNLDLVDPFVLLQSPLRENLQYRVIHTENKIRDLVHLLENTEESSIIYVDKRSRTRMLERELQSRGFKVSAFHGGLDSKERIGIISQWNTNALKVIVATKAFGMGMDKPDVRYVIHYALPDSFEAYVQEAGRAGRDGNSAKAVLLWSAYDIDELKSKTETYFPEKSKIRLLYHNIAKFLGMASGKLNDEWLDFDINDFCSTHKTDKLFCLNALSILESAGYIQLSDQFKHPSRLSLDEFKLKHFLNGPTRNPKLEAFIRIVLRTYEGILYDKRPIDEIQLSRKNGIKTEDVSRMLDSINTLEIGRYQKQFSGYKLNFRGFRYAHNKIEFPPHAYAQRRQTMKRHNADIVDYIHTDRCRQSYISEYFGFKPDSDCGICDNCETPLSSFELETLTSDLVEKKVRLSKKLLDLGSENREKLVSYLESQVSEEKLAIKNDRVLNIQ